MRKCWLFLALLWSFGIGAQDYVPVNGVKDERPEHFAITGAKIQVSPGVMLDSATLLVKKGRVVAVGADITIPKGAVVYSMDGKYIYPSFIEMYADYGMPKEEKPEVPPRTLPPLQSAKRGPYSWNAAIHPEVKAFSLFEPENTEAARWRKGGFGSVLTHRTDGIVRGSGCWVHLVEGTATEAMGLPEAAAFYSFSKGTSPQRYPTSLMGAIALLRQTFYNAQWYGPAYIAGETIYNASLAAMEELRQLPAIFSVKSGQSVVRALDLAREFNLPVMIKGTGESYQVRQALAEEDVRLLVPLNFPRPYDVSHPEAALEVSLGDMMHWEYAPANAALLHRSGIDFAFTTDGLGQPEDIFKAIQKVREYGLPDSIILAALTTRPAAWLGLSEEAGTLTPRSWANFFITATPLWHPKVEVLEHWVKGHRYIAVHYPSFDLRGDFQLLTAEDTFRLAIRGTFAHPTIKARAVDSTLRKASLKFLDNNVTLTIAKVDTAKEGGYLRLTGEVLPTQWKGTGVDEDGQSFKWRAILQAPYQDTADLSPDLHPLPDSLPYPLSGYGRKSLPQQAHILFRNATVWTSEKEGILRNSDVRINKGVIEAIGQNLSPNGATVIDATGLHLTAGIIDEHSHIAIERGVNEASEAVTAEVRIGDVIDAEDVNIYRQLAGGVTTSQLLHGSANPIGGQSAIIKLRWGALADEMKIRHAPGFIKFALGENVKQSNWGDQYTRRFPQTRMGVEQVFYDAFFRAEAYLRDWEAYRDLSRRERELAPPFRRDLELEALGEILRKERFVTCHSYVQSEINMLMEVADSFAFTLNTFTHILEGYKIADQMKAHGAGASTFSDWWAYKYEVMDAIPYNAALLSRMGVVTAVNSDDAEMGRRLNQEAAKAIKYGGLSEEAAWNLVTINPARLLHIDHKVGSIKVGKDADVVLWSGYPMSVYAHPLQTYVDGRCYFDRKHDEALQTWVRQERQRLIRKMLQAIAKGASTQPVKAQREQLYHCDDIKDEGF